MTSEGLGGAPPPPPMRSSMKGPGPGLDSLDSDFENSTLSTVSQNSGSPSGSRKRITLGGLAHSSHNAAHGAAAGKPPVVVNKAKPKRVPITTRQPVSVARPDDVSPPP